MNENKSSRTPEQKHAHSSGTDRPGHRYDKAHGQKHHEHGGGHASHHAHMAADFKKRFWISLGRRFRFSRSPR